MIVYIIVLYDPIVYMIQLSNSWCTLSQIFSNIKAGNESKLWIAHTTLKHAETIFLKSLILRIIESALIRNF